MSRLPLRVRLVSGFILAMLVLLTAAGAFVYWRVEYALDRGLDTELDQATAVITPLVAPSGQVTSLDAADATGAGWQVLDHAGRVLDSGGTAPEAPLVTTADLGQLGAGTLTKDIGQLLPIAAQPYRVQVTTLEPSDHYLVVGVRRDHRDEALRELLAQLTLAGLGALAVAAVVGDVLARAALRPVERYRRRAAEIAEGANGLRLDVPDGRDDEVTRLGHTLNDMLAALEGALEHERRFIHDASHELRTPLTLLKSRIQLARRRSRSVEELESVLEELAVDVARLTDLAEQLLALGAVETAPELDVGTDVNQLVRDVVTRRNSVQPDGTDPITIELPGTPTHAILSPHALDRILTNLIDNALTHGAPPVHVRVRAADREDDEPKPRPGRPAWTVIEVSDAGSGIAPDLMPEATQRFTRSAEARSGPGAGLGLSIVEQLVLNAGGELRLCHGDHHVRSRTAAAPISCDHSAAMTASVLLPG